jgi:hypothetical protein
MRTSVYMLQNQEKSNDRDEGISNQLGSMVRSRGPMVSGLDLCVVASGKATEVVRLLNRLELTPA